MLRKALVAAKVKVRELFSELLEEEQAIERARRVAAGPREALRALLAQLREEASRAQEPEARALLETSAEVIGGLLKAFDHYLSRS